MANKTLTQQIREAFPELDGTALVLAGILLQNDSDGTGDYIAAWTYEKPIPAELESYLRA